jgi:hypothetical protein
MRRINEDFLDTVDLTDTISTEEEPHYGGSYDIVIYIDLQTMTDENNIISKRILKVLSAMPSVDAVERLQIIFNPQDNYDHIPTEDYEYKCWNTFISGAAPNSIAFGIVGNFRDKLRNAMGIINTLCAISSKGERFALVEILTKTDDQSIYLNLKTISAILEYNRTKEWPRTPNDFNVIYRNLSEALRYITGKPMQAVQEFMFKCYNASEMYIVCNRRLFAHGNTQQFRVAERSS